MQRVCLVRYDACMLGAYHSRPVTRSQWKGDKYLPSLIPVSKGGRLGFVAGVGVVDLLRRRRLSCWLAGWSDEGDRRTRGPRLLFSTSLAEPHLR